METSGQRVHFHLAQALFHLNQLASLIPFFETNDGEAIQYHRHILDEDGPFPGFRLHGDAMLPIVTIYSWWPSYKDDFESRDKPSTWFSTSSIS